QADQRHSPTLQRPLRPGVRAPRRRPVRRARVVLTSRSGAQTMNRTRAVVVVPLIVALAVLATTHPCAAQTREKGPWWPSPQGASDQAGAANYITPEKVVKAMQLVKTGRIYELGFIYEASMPQYGDRPYYLNVT